MQQYQWVCFYIILKKQGTRTQTTNHDSNSRGGAMASCSGCSLETDGNGSPTSQFTCQACIRDDGSTLTAYIDLSMPILISSPSRLSFY
jgi:hypothetical protein